MVVFKVGSSVKVKTNDKKGVILELNEKGDFAKISIDQQVSWYPTSDLEQDFSLIDRLLKNQFDDGLDFILSVDAYRLLTEYKFNPYVLASSTKIFIFPHQIDEVIRVLDDPRMMIADEVGLGKTIIAALVFSELRARGLASKALFIVPKSLVIKWRDELKGRFETDAVIANSEYVRANAENPFKKESFCYIASMDYLKQNHVMKLMEESNFDFIVVDEAHKFSYGTDRFSLGEFLAQRTNLLLFLTATPHNGNNDDFAQRMKLLDPYFHYSSASSISHLITRNIKEDVVDLEGKEVFPPRESKTLDVSLTNRELHLLKDMIDSYIAERISEAKTKEELNAVRFLTTIIRKRASSSIHSLRKTLEKRLDKLGKYENVEGAMREMRNSEDDFDEEAYERNEDNVIGYSIARSNKEREELKELISQIDALGDTDSKLERIIQFIRKTKDTDAAAKMVIFTEYRDTMNYLKEKLSQSYRVGNIDGTMTIEERSDALAEFRRPEGNEIMVCTDAAGEGIDMQFCNIEVNYDLPWNPNKLEQRMGRIHRIGQDKKVYYYNFVISETIDGYILEKLLNKIENIKEAIGDKVYDVIGRLVQEAEIAELYEELLRAPKEQWEAKIKKIDGIIEEKRRILREINSLLAGHRLDRTKLEDMKKTIKDAIDKDEVKRFVEVYLSSNRGKLEELNSEQQIYRVFFPRRIAISLGKGVIEGSFRGDVAIKKNYSYIALGNPQVMTLVNDAAKPSVAYLKHPYLSGIAFFFKVIIKDGKGRDRNGKVVGFLVNDSGVREIDVRGIWDFELMETIPAAIDESTSSELEVGQQKAEEQVSKIADELLVYTRQRLGEVEEKTKEAVIRYYSRQMEEIDSKIRDYRSRIAEGPHFARLIQKESIKLNKTKEELDEKLAAIARDFQTINLSELVGIAVIVAEEGSDIRRRIELAGMKAVMEYESKRAENEAQRAKIKDISERFKGFDIESFDRAIEVKSFKTTGSVELTSHEWLIASKVQKDYWLYVVEDALTNPKITLRQDPFNTFRNNVRKVPVVEYRYIIDDWKS